MSWYHAAVLLHVLAALFWLGGMFFLAVVGAPVLRRVEPALRAALFRDLGRRFRAAGWIAIGILLATGTWVLHLRGLLRADVLGEPAFWSTRYGHSLAIKLAAVTVMVALAAVHDFVLGPRASSAPPGEPSTLRLRRITIWIARVNALVGLLLVYAATLLARGG